MRSKEGYVTFGKDSLEEGMPFSLSLEFKRKLKEFNTLAFLNVGVNII